MKQFLLFVTMCLVFGAAQAQVKSGDAVLDKRLADYLQANADKDYEKIMDFMHPKLFKIAPREMMINVIKSAFESEEMEISLADMAITSIETTSFKSAGVEYRKASYSMTMKIRILDSSANDPDYINLMTETFQAAFEDKKVTYDKKTKTFLIKGTDILYAIKDPGKEWMFLGYKNDPDLIKKLFSKEVADHYHMLD